jgi:light-regulated signal transduction histidine kinase (bacteriophytochrome)
MKIGSKERIATAILLAVIGVIALAVWWTYAEVEDARRERREASEIARAQTDLRLVTFEYALNHHERARAQWREVSRRIDRLIAAARFSDQAEQEILARVRDRRTQARQIFDDLESVSADDRTDATRAELNRRFEAQLFSRLFILQQDNLTATFRLSDVSTERSTAAQRRLLAVILSGLALIALIQFGVSWLIRRNVLAPVARLQHAAQQVAAGNWSFEFGTGGSDEIGQLTRSLDSMTQSLRNSLGQVERSNQELATLNKELEAFSYSVSHDLRGPLRSMDGFSLVLLEDYGDKLDEEGRDALERIRAASQRMGRLIDDLLRLSQVTRAELKMKRVDLSGMAQSVAELLQGDRSGRTVEWAIEEGMTITADTELMRILMQNLLQNAWKFTGKTEKPTIRVGTLERDGTKVCFVADNGVGFDMAHADRLFGAFQRLHHAADFPGTGIGLAIAQRIIHRHDGEIWAEAKEGEGATFFFTAGDLRNDSSRQQDHLAG